ncbi:MAG: ClbS/DfsB family four-helix bundle protein [Nitrospirae bacterium]|nr:ClbS/DfsB family four-helix bundle protein [Nitrospirota bacterium]
MPSPEAAQLAEAIRFTAEEIKRLYEGIDEKTASAAPAGRWSPKQILSHLCGPEGVGYMPLIRAFLEQDTPRLDLDAGNPFFSEKRSHMTVTDLVSEFENEYSNMADLVSGLSVEQLSRKAHIPFLKETPLGEYPTLATWIKALGERHVVSHIDHLREIMEALDAAKSS